MDFQVRINKLFGKDNQVEQVKFSKIPKLATGVTDEELKKMDSNKRQEFIFDQLNAVRYSKNISPGIRFVVEAIMKALLLDKGESIDVDFSKKDLWYVDWTDKEDDGTAQFDSLDDANKWIKTMEDSERYNKTGFQVIEGPYQL